MGGVCNAGQDGSDGRQHCTRDDVRGWGEEKGVRDWKGKRGEFSGKGRSSRQSLLALEVPEICGLKQLVSIISYPIVGGVEVRLSCPDTSLSFVSLAKQPPHLLCTYMLVWHRATHSLTARIMDSTHSDASSHIAAILALYA